MVKIKKEKNGYIIYDNGETIKLPRVTKVIGYCQDLTKSPQFQNWQKRMGGASVASKYTSGFSSMGTKIHKAVEKYNQGDLTSFNKAKDRLEEVHIVDPSTGKVFDSKKAQKVLDNQLKLFTKVNPHKLTLKDKKVYYMEGIVAFAGELDEIVDIPKGILLDTENNKNIDGTCIVDLKNSSKQKSVVYLLNYLVQQGAYTLAWNQRHPEKPINQFAVSIASPTKVNVWYCNPAKTKYYQSWFKKMVKAYIKGEKFNWTKFEMNSGISKSKDNYPVVSRFNMLPSKLKFI